MVKSRHKYISRIITQFFDSRYAAEVEKGIQSWIVSDRFVEEKEDAILNIWENLPTNVDSSTYEALRKMQQRLNMEEPKKTVHFIPFRRHLTRIAAILIPIIFMIGGYYIFFNKGTSVTELTAPYGQISERVLSDGTEVWVNSGSTITYDENFKASERIVSLSGEACFDVEKDLSKPFVINTEHLSIRVLGTQLNVKAFPQEDREVVTLASGSVQVSTADGAAHKISPNQQLIYNNKTSEILIENVIASDFLGWREGQLLLDDSSFDDILSAIERHHNVEIVIDGDFVMPDEIYTIRFVSQESIDQAIVVLHELIGAFDYEVKNSTIYIRNKAVEEPETLPQELSVTPEPEQPVESKIRGTIVSIDSADISYKGIFDQIELQTGYSVAFNQSRFDAYRTLSNVLYTESDINDVLADILDGTGFMHKTEENHVLIIEESGLQEINGYVIDSQKREPVANATIATAKKNVKTDGNGYFSIDHLKPGEYYVSVDASGYHSASRSVSLTEENGVSMKIHVIELVPHVTDNITTRAIVNNPVSYEFARPSGRMDRPHFTIKTDLLYLFGTYTPNLGVEFSLSNRFTVNIQAGYNPFALSNGRRLEHLLVQPEIRYWPTFAFSKHFIGLHMNYGSYDIANVGLKRMKSHAYEGAMIGAGITYGYNYRISKRWAIEGVVGFGYTLFDHNKTLYEIWNEDKELIESSIIKENYNYLGITKLGISWIYTIK